MNIIVISYRAEKLFLLYSINDSYRIVRLIKVFSADFYAVRKYLPCYTCIIVEYRLIIVLIQYPLIRFCLSGLWQNKYWHCRCRNNPISTSSSSISMKYIKSDLRVKDFLIFLRF